MTEKIQCPRCTMTFEVSDTPASHNWGRAEMTRCAEPKCGKPFWHGARSATTEYGDSRSFVRTGIHPDWLHEWGYDRRHSGIKP